MRTGFWVLLAAATLAGCGSTTGPTAGTDFLVDVSGETFVLRVADPATVRLAMENLQGANAMFPIGPLRAGGGGFNPRWSWHFDPNEVRMTEVAIEVCDGRPSYVEAHLADFPTYCPWGARVVAVLP